jgi:hypothetical protein
VKRDRYNWACCFGRCSHGGVESIGGLLVAAGGATITDTGLMVLLGLITLANGDLDVS